MIATAKHFPGHGDTAVDSHRGLPEINVGRERLNTVELVPFEAQSTPESARSWWATSLAADRRDSDQAIAAER